MPHTKWYLCRCVFVCCAEFFSTLYHTFLKALFVQSSLSTYMYKPTVVNHQSMQITKLFEQCHMTLHAPCWHSPCCILKYIGTFSFISHNYLSLAFHMTQVIYKGDHYSYHKLHCIYTKEPLPSSSTFGFEKDKVPSVIVCTRWAESSKTFNN